LRAVAIRGSARALDRLTSELAEPVARLQGGAWSRERLAVLLARAELRAWRIESIEGPGLLSGRCPLGSGAVTLAYVGEPVGGGPDIGGYVVGRAIPVARGRWVLLGRASLVAGDEVAAGFERLLVSLRAPRGEFWRVHGGVIARAARACARVPSAPRAILAT